LIDLGDTSVSGTDEYSASNIRRSIAAGLVVFLSLLLPICVLCGSVLWFVSSNPLGWTSNDLTIFPFRGIVKNGEIWFVVDDLRDDIDLPGFRFRIRDGFRIKRLNLATGIEREPEQVVINERCYFNWINGELYGVGSTDNAVYKRAQGSLVKIAARPPRTGRLASRLFVDGGRLACIDVTKDGAFRLIYLVDGQCVDGGTIVLPQEGSRWIEGTDHTYKFMSPPSTANPTLQQWASLRVDTVSHERQLHLFLSDLKGVSAYRCGLPVADDDPNATSALTPANSLHEMTGWERIQPVMENDHWDFMASDRNGLLFSSRGSPQRIVRRTFDGTWHDINTRGLNSETLIFLEDHTEKTAYVTNYKQRRSSAVVYRIEGNSLQPISLHSSERERRYLYRWGQLVAGLLVAWLLHISVLTGGIHWLTRNDFQSEYQFGNERAHLAPTWRRGLALTIDLLLSLFVFFLLVYFELQSFGFRWKPSNETSICESLFEFEKLITDGLQSGAFVPTRVNLLAIAGYLLNQDGAPAYVIMLVANVIVVCCLFVWTERRIGQTPGKTLCGIRNVRTTLQPTGFSRTLLRDVAYWIDIPLFASPIPAAISMMLSRHRQRLGDRIADTILIRQT
jgi:uncharacterized RDD family membrane protein YckC